MSNLNFNYYLITDRKACAPRPLPDVVEEACSRGIKAIQLREKDLNGRELFKLANQLREITVRHNARLFINDRADIAMAAGADGVHCREQSLSPQTIKQLNSDFIVGASVHSVARAKRAAREGADFLLFGPVFYTASKAQYGEPQGLDQLEKVVEAVSVPVIGVGGITPQRTKSCMKNGAAGVAGISSIMKSESINETINKWENVLPAL